MTIKEKVIQALSALPENASIEDAMDKLLFLAKIEKGLQQAQEDKVIPHEYVMKFYK